MTPGSTHDDRRAAAGGEPDTGHELMPDVPVDADARAAGDAVELEEAEEAQAAGEARDADTSARSAGTDALAVGLGYLASFAYPLVSLPFLTRVVGKENLGHLMFALAVLQIVIFTVDFGFGGSALRRIAVATSKEERSRVVAATIGAKLLIWVAASAVLMAVVMAGPSMRELWLMYLLGLLLIGLGALFPAFLLQGVGRAKQFAVFTAVSRLVALALLLLTVHGPEDLALAMLWQQFPLALSAILCWVFLITRWQDVRVVRTSLAQIRDAFSDSGALFISNISVLMMGTANTVVLGIVSTRPDVAYFGSGERFSNAARGVLRGVVDAMLPRMTREGVDARALQRRISWGIFGAYAISAVMLVANAPWFIPWYLGDTMRGTIPVMQLMGFSLIFVGIGTVLQLHVTAQHRFSAIAKIAGAGGIFHLIALIPASWLWGSLGASVALVISEAFLAALYVIDARRHRARTAADENAAVAADATDGADGAEGTAHPGSAAGL